MLQQQLGNNGGRLGTDGPVGALVMLKAAFKATQGTINASKQAYFKGVHAIVVAADGKSKIDVANRYDAPDAAPVLQPLICGQLRGQQRCSRRQR
jgi:hypothetical protein